jgi:hypothetical protein
MADRQALANALMSDQAAMQPETYANPAVLKIIANLLSLPKRAIDASAGDMQHLGDHNYRPRSIGPAVETAANMMGGVGAVPAEVRAIRMGLQPNEEM